MGKALPLLLGFLFTVIFSGTALSMDYHAVFQDAEIAEATITPTDKAGVSILRFKMTNVSIDNLTILGVSGNSHQKSRIMAELDPEKFVNLESLSLPSEESLDMSGAGIFVELINFQPPLKSGGAVALNLILISGELPFKAHLVDPGKHIAPSN